MAFYGHPYFRLVDASDKFFNDLADKIDPQLKRKKWAINLLIRLKMQQK